MDMPGHGGHGGHGGGHDGHGGDDSSQQMCAMNMSLNWSTENVCVLFNFWRINSTTSLVFTCAAVFLLGYLYEFSRARIRTWERSLLAGTDNTSSSTDSSMLLPRGIASISNSVRRKRAVYYGLMVAYSYSLMLIFMTYNGYLILAIIGGAVAGHYVYSIDELGFVRGANCH
ncbi:Ctr copper transporter family-domain-containing protein [Coemansia spiralis]|nr:Ctr copper transporter family-domain-containing protein [Coemansia spiralis]